MFSCSPVGHVGSYVGDEADGARLAYRQPVEMAPVDTTGGCTSARRVG